MDVRRETITDRDKIHAAFLRFMKDASCLFDLFERVCMHKCYSNVVMFLNMNIKSNLLKYLDKSDLDFNVYHTSLSV